MNGHYVITLKNCAFFSTHGVMEEEERLGQRFYVDITMQIEDETAVLHDDFSEAVDYGEVYRIINDVVTGRRFKLIEALAHAIAVSVSRHYDAIRRIEVTVRKPSAPVPGLLDHAEAKVAYDVE
ncbi:dihydroneopterin aldolase [Martelella radicis]|uniref:7,8-dihydroneopterin aldolase n=1 Tax=Martelella radicis TaxID=1397476 RepID=A0A7W6P9H6_9HYPH|nr:dihydroneopterin aldolase [Martelella radicis]MBB4121825.1 dihydroneopterin aldolase [Martelella radicis]